MYACDSLPSKPKLVIIGAFHVFTQECNFIALSHMYLLETDTDICGDGSVHESHCKAGRSTCAGLDGLVAPLD